MSGEESHSDWVLVEDLRVHARVGRDPHERQAPQRLLVSLAIAVDNSKVLASGSIEDGVNYHLVAQQVREFLSQGEHVLLEQCAHTIIGDLFQEFSAAKRIEVTLKKFYVAEANWTGVRICRDRH